MAFGKKLSLSLFVPFFCFNFRAKKMGEKKVFRLFSFYDLFQHELKKYDLPPPTNTAKHPKRCPAKKLLPLNHLLTHAHARNSRAHAQAPLLRPEARGGLRALWSLESAGPGGHRSDQIESSWREKEDGGGGVEEVLHSGGGWRRNKQSGERFLAGKRTEAVQESHLNQTDGESEPASA